MSGGRTAARTAGASSEIARFDDERVFVVERYDRRRGPADIITTIRSVFAGEADVDRFVQALVFKYLAIEDWKKFAASAYIDFGVIETAIARYSPALVDAVADSARPMELDADERAFAARFTDVLAEHLSRIVGR